MSARHIARVAAAALLAAMVAGCGAQWGTSVWNPQTSCEAFGGEYTGNGNCSYEAP
jgi:hypothetical protein